MESAPPRAPTVPPLETPVRSILLDYGMTLATYRRPTAELEAGYAAIRRLLRERARHPENVPDAEVLLAGVHDRIEAAVLQHEKQGELREINLDVAYRDAYGALGLRLDRRTRQAVQLIEQRAWFNGMQVSLNVPATIGALHWRGVRVGLCSNAPWLPQGMLEQLDHVGLRPLLDSITLSGAVGWRKPSPRVFRRALRDLGARPATTLMVGDRVREDVDGAHAVGIRAVRLRAHADDADGTERADCVLDSLTDLIALVDRCNGTAGGDGSPAG